MKLDLKTAKALVEQAIPIHKFIGDIRRRRWHGGILATVMDSVGGLAGMTHLSSLDDKLATIDLRVDYLKGAEAEGIVVEGEIVRLGNRILVTKMTVWDAAEKEVLAEGKGVYNFIRMKDKAML